MNKMARVPPVIVDTLVRDTLHYAYETKTEYRWSLAYSGGRILDLKWGQGLPHTGEYEGAFCPNKVAGCVMIAALHVMGYYKQPSSMNFTFPERDCDYAVLDWNSICGHKVYHDKTYVPNEDNGYSMMINNPCTASDEDHLNLGRIARQIGYDLNATYNFYPSASTGAVTSDMVDYLCNGVIPNLSYTRLTWNNTSSNKSSIRNCLESNIAVVRGTSIRTENNQQTQSGHAWVCDGYEVLNYLKNYYRRRIPDGNLYTSEWELISSDNLGQHDFYHYNWGWNGRCNGYFAANVFDVDQQHVYDAGESGITQDYNFNISVKYYLLTR